MLNVVRIIENNFIINKKGLIKLLKNVEKALF